MTTSSRASDRLPPYFVDSVFVIVLGVAGAVMIGDGSIESRGWAGLALIVAAGARALAVMLTLGFQLLAARADRRARAGLRDDEHR